MVWMQCYEFGRIDHTCECFACNQRHLQIMGQNVSGNGLLGYWRFIQKSSINNLPEWVSAAPKLSSAIIPPEVNHDGGKSFHRCRINVPLQQASAVADCKEAVFDKGLPDQNTQWNRRECCDRRHRDFTPARTQPTDRSRPGIDGKPRRKHAKGEKTFTRSTEIA